MAPFSAVTLHGTITKEALDDPGRECEPCPVRVAIYDLPDNFRAAPFLANQERRRVVGLT